MKPAGPVRATKDPETVPQAGLTQSTPDVGISRHALKNIVRRLAADTRYNLLNIQETDQVEPVLPTGFRPRIPIWSRSFPLHKMCKKQKAVART